jgi:glycosyltransferase involved in cell wall biosynthesis
VIVVDDASDDASALTIIEQARDNRVHHLRFESPRGMAGVRNAGIEAAAGELVAFLDDDDLWAPDKLVRQLRTIAGDAQFAYSGVVSVNDVCRPIAVFRAPEPARLAERLLSENAIPAGPSNVVVTRRALEETSGFDERMGPLADWDLWIRLAGAFAGASEAAVSVAYVHHGENHSLGADDEARGDFDRLKRKHAAAREALGVRLGEAEFVRWVAGTRRRAGDRRGAARLYMHSARAGPSVTDLGRAAIAAAGIPAPRRRIGSVAWLQPCPGLELPNR